MLKTVSGTFKSGVVRLEEAANDLPDGPVLVTFLQAGADTAKVPSLSPEQAAELRGKLTAWEEDWNAPGMSVYD